MYIVLEYGWKEDERKKKRKRKEKRFGIAGFEPATPCSQSRCSTKLSYIPD